VLLRTNPDLAARRTKELLEAARRELATNRNEQRALESRFGELALLGA
jgi:hypothetical protein